MKDIFSMSDMREPIERRYLCEYPDGSKEPVWAGSVVLAFEVAMSEYGKRPIRVIPAGGLVRTQGDNRHDS